MTILVRTVCLLALMFLLAGAGVQAGPHSFPIVDTHQDQCYDTTQVITCPDSGGSFFGQDVHYLGLSASYVDNGDGTISDLNTGRIWLVSL